MIPTAPGPCPRTERYAMKTNILRGAIRGFLASVLFAARAAEDPATSTATEEQRSLPWEKASIKFGGFISTFDSTVEFGINQGGSGLSFNGEDNLGLDSNLTVFRADALYRPGKSLRNQLDFSYGAYHRDGRATLSEQITIGDVTY